MVSLWDGQVLKLYIWDKVFKFGPSKICGRPYPFKFFKGCLPQIFLVHSWILCAIMAACNIEFFWRCTTFNPEIIPETYLFKNVDRVYSYCCFCIALVYLRYSKEGKCTSEEVHVFLQEFVKKIRWIGLGWLSKSAQNTWKNFISVCIMLNIFYLWQNVFSAYIFRGFNYGFQRFIYFSPFSDNKFR